ncbi:MAG: phosphotransferase, partial [Planctomycetes bacterium]|nr:phosphotransferase [Planctomycetota bacterium]
QINDMTLRLVDQITHVVDELSQAPPTLIHVDTHLDNILFDLPETVVLIDWPSAAVGPAAVDFTHFITTSISTPVRRSVAERLLDEYLEVLRNCGVRNYGLDDLRRDTTLAALRLWAGMTTGYGAADPADLIDRQRELHKIEIRRMVGFAEDWHFAEFLEESFGERPNGR